MKVAIETRQTDTAPNERPFMGRMKGIAIETGQNGHDAYT